jgi:hypothetical protein
VIRDVEGLILGRNLFVEFVDVYKHLRMALVVELSHNAYKKSEGMFGSSCCYCSSCRH